MSVNKVTLLGNLGADPELRHTPSGKAVCNFRIATAEKWKDNNGQAQERTEWHTIVVWGKLAELCNQYLKKGRQVYLEGKLQTRDWDDKNGVKRYTTEIISDTVQFLGGSKPAENSTQPANVNTAQNAAGENLSTPEANPDFTGDDIPF